MFPSGAKAPSKIAGLMYGLKPVPFTLPSGAKAPSDSADIMRGLKPPPPSAVPSERLKPCPFKAGGVSASG